MASKKAGRLAGLAALAGLAYMANKKGETKDAVKRESKPEVKKTPADDRDDSERVIGFRAPVEDERSAPTGMGAATELVTQNATNKLSSPDFMFAQEPGPYKTDDKAMFEKEPGPYLKSNGVNKQGNVNKVNRSMNGNVNDGGRSMVERQNAGAKRANLSVNDYIISGKQAIDKQDGTFKGGGKVKKMASGGVTSSASKRGDGIAQRGKTKGRVC